MKTPALFAALALVLFGAATAQPTPAAAQATAPAFQPVQFAAGRSQPVPLSPQAWTRAPNYAGPVGGAQAGLVLQGGPWTNGRMQNGAYDGNRVFSAQTFDLSGGGDVYMRFLADGGGQYMVFWPRVLDAVGMAAFSTHHSWAGSVVVPERTWLFAHVRVEPGGGFAASVSSGDYDDRGGRVIYRNSGRLTRTYARLDLQFGDNYAGPAAAMVIGEAIVSAAPGGSRAAPPPVPVPGGPRAGGGQCNASTDCDSGICLLGICAPPSR